MSIFAKEVFSELCLNHISDWRLHLRSRLRLRLSLDQAEGSCWRLRLAILIYPFVYFS